MKRCVVAFALLFVAAAAYGADDARLKKVDQLGKAAIASSSAPGLAIGVMRHGRIVFLRGYGFADLENRVPVSLNSEFSVASITKNFTAVAILELLERGSLSLADDIGKYLPDFPQRSRGVTIRRLLSHRGGVHDVTAIRAYWNQIGEPIDRDHLIKIFADAPLDFAPGERYAYSNSGYILLGAVIEKASGLSYDAFLRKNVFAPLHLTQTSYCGTSALVPGRVRGYAKDGKRFVSARRVHMSQGYAAGGVCSTAGDLLKWERSLFSGKILGPQTLRQMTTPEDGQSYGFGIGVGSNFGHRVYFHAGGISGFDAMMTYYPDDDTGIVVLANASGELAGRLEAKIARLVLGIRTPAVRPLNDAERKRFEGVYHSAIGFDVRVFNKSDALFAQTDDDEPVRLSYIGNGQFITEDDPAIISITGDHMVQTQYGATRFEAVTASSTRQP